MKTLFNTPPLHANIFGEFFQGRVMRLGVMSLCFSLLKQSIQARGDTD